MQHRGEMMMGTTDSQVNKQAERKEGRDHRHRKFNKAKWHK